MIRLILFHSLLFVLLLAACQVSGKRTADSDPGAMPSGTLAFTWKGGLGEMDGSGGNLRALVDEVPNGLLLQPAWSPDGKSLAFVKWSTRQVDGLSLPESEIYLADADGKNVRLAVPHQFPGVSIQYPAWSADGQALYFTRSEPVNPARPYDGFRVDIRRRALAGGVEESLVPNGTSPHLSRDGGRMVYLATSPVGPSVSLFVSAPDGSNPKELTRTGEFLMVLAPKLSPSGTKIVFAGAVPPASDPNAKRTPSSRQPLLGPFGVHVAQADGLPMDLWTIGSDGRDLKRLTHLAEDSPYPAWSSDGQRIAFLGIGGMYVVNADGSDLRKISSAVSHGQVDWKFR